MRDMLRSALLVIITYTLSVWSQSILSSQYPFGLPLRSLSSTALSMGGVSAGIPNDHHVMLSNPANLGTIDITAFSSLWLVDYMRINEGELYTDHISTTPRQLSFALPLGIVGTIAFSLQKTTDATIKYREEKEEISNVNTSTGNINTIKSIFTRISFDREGGTTSWQAGWGKNIGKYINVGFAYQRYYFSTSSTKLSDVSYTNKIITTTIDSTTNQNKKDTTFTEEFITERDSSYLSIRGNSLRFGILGTIKNFSVGIAVTYIFKDNLHYFDAIYNGLSSQPIDSAILKNQKYSLQMPHSIATGISYAISPKWLVGADLNIDLWNKYSVEGYEIVKNFNAENTISFSAGFRFIPSPDLLVPKYFETIHYRSGFRYTQLPGKTSSEISGALGLGFPLKGNGLLDIGFELGKRTHDNYSNYNETFLQVSIGLNGGRKWNKTPTSTY